MWDLYGDSSFVMWCLAGQANRIVLVVKFGGVVKRRRVVKRLGGTVRSKGVSRSCVFANRPNSNGGLLTKAFTSALRYRTKNARPYRGYSSYGGTVNGGRPSVVVIDRRGPKAVAVSRVESRIVGSVSVEPCCDPCGVCVVTSTSLVAPRTRGTLLGAVRRPPRCTIVLLLAGGVKKLLPAVRSEYIHLSLGMISSNLMGGCLVRRLRIPSCRTRVSTSFTRNDVKETGRTTASRRFTRVARGTLEVLGCTGAVRICRLSSTVGDLSRSGRGVGSCLSVFRF